ncbi:hypothetical protein K502DRAFT_200890 [Neoconidiobolus thromboides FSU 785]|nr:hypothetical protein K502DRAFT_200890 [Neoconidiobolus thromboides FSU 785]
MDQEFLLQEIEDIKKIGKYGYKVDSFKQIGENKVEIEILENIKLTIVLSDRGFLIQNSQPIQNYVGNIYESMDSLLSEVSPLYRKKFTELLFDQLIFKR